MKKHSVEVVVSTKPTTEWLEEYTWGMFQSEDLIVKTLELSSTDFTKDCDHITIALPWEPYYIDTDEGYIINLYAYNEEEAEEQIKIIEEFYS